MLSNEALSKIKKGTKLVVNNGLGRCNAISMESVRQGKGYKKTLLVDLKGSEIGFFDEVGSVYTSDILEVEGSNNTTTSSNFKSFKDLGCTFNFHGFDGETTELLERDLMAKLEKL